MRDNIAKITIGLSLITLTGCGSTPQHTNTLLFATSTKFAIDASATPTGSPEVTVGYKRQEGVWMPLLANQASGVPATCPTGSDCIFQGKEKKDGEKTDTYSVLASFGATFGGSADTAPTDGTTPKASAKVTGGLAQFFATGIAAQKLADRGGASLVSVQPAAVEEARANVAEKKLETLLGTKNYEEALADGKGKSSLLLAKKDVILASISTNKALDKSKWDALVDKSTLPAPDKMKLKVLDTFDKVNNELTLDSAMTGTTINPLHSAVQ